MRGAISIAALALILTLPIFSVACTETKTEELQILSHNMTVHKFSGDVLQSTAVITGKAKNISNYPLESALITINFYDKKPVPQMGTYFIRKDNQWQNIQILGSSSRVDAFKFQSS